jgi:regulator of protease activity HflC (stomatin/prohibitin superfamily)
VGTDEKILRPTSGWFPLFILLGGMAVLGYSLLIPGGPVKFLGTIVLLVVVLFCFKGLFTLQPNQAAVMVFFGDYAGSAKEAGFFWVNPFYSRTRISLRVNNLNTPVLKVNDARGSPVEIAAVIAWRVSDTAKAMFDVESYAHYLQVQSESAVRQVASSHPYDHSEQDTAHQMCLQKDLDAISRLLGESIQQHSEVAGIVIEEAKIAHLAYAAEIASVMLRRQQAEAVVMARQRLVEGAVGMVEGALKQLEDKKIVNLTPDQRAVLVTNMMTVLLSESGAQPVIQMAQARE